MVVVGGGNERMLVLKLTARGLGWGLTRACAALGGVWVGWGAAAADQEEGTRQGCGAVLGRSRRRDKAPTQGLTLRPGRKSWGRASEAGGTASTRA